MNLLDGHKEYLVMPFEPAFPEMLRFKRYYKNTDQMFWDWILGITILSSYNLGIR